MYSLSTVIFAIVIILVVIVNKKYQIDPSVGETKPKITDKAQYPKFYVHFVTALASFLAMHMLGVPIVWGVILLGTGIFGYEWSQGFWNKLDIVAGFAGIALAIALIWIYYNVFHQNVLTWW